MVVRILTLIVLFFLSLPLSASRKSAFPSEYPTQRTTKDSQTCCAELNNCRGTLNAMEDSLGFKTKKLGECETSLGQEAQKVRLYETDLKRFIDSYNKEKRLREDLASKNVELASKNVELLRTSRALESKLKEQEQFANKLDRDLATLKSSINRKPQQMLATDDLSGKSEETKQLGLTRIECNGRVREIRELVIGTLEVQDVSYKVPVPSTFDLKAIFKPHSLLATSDEASNASWFLELKFQPDKIQDVQYDVGRSNGPEKRKVGDKVEEWIWKIRPTQSFQKDVPKLFGRASYESSAGNGGPTEIENRDIQIIEEPIAGTFELIMGFITRNFTVLLGALTALFGVIAAYLGLKRNQLEVAVSELKLRLEEISKSTIPTQQPDIVD